VNRTEGGSHQIVVYPDLSTFRQIYAHYVHNQLQNEIVLMLPFYETAENVKAVLSKFRDDGGKKIAVAKHVDDGSLLIIDAYEAFFKEGKKLPKVDSSDIAETSSNHSNIVSLMRIMQNQVGRLDKEGMTILLDTGCFFQNGSVEYVLMYERSVPRIFDDTGIKQLCMYHQKDFERRLNITEKGKILESHGRSVLMLDS
jgi:hypothetical protein